MDTTKEDNRRYQGYEYLVVMELADRSLGTALMHERIAANEWPLVAVGMPSRSRSKRSIGRIESTATSSALNIVRVHAQSDDFTTFFSWQLIDFTLPALWSGPFGCQAALVRLLPARDGYESCSAAAGCAYGRRDSLRPLTSPIARVTSTTGAPASRCGTRTRTIPSRGSTCSASLWSKRKLANRLADFRRGTNAMATRAALRDLVGKLLEPEPAEREKHFGPVDGELLTHRWRWCGSTPFLGSPTSLETATLERLDTRLRQIQIDVSAIRDLTQENLYELRRTTGGANARNLRGHGGDHAHCVYHRPGAAQGAKTTRRRGSP